MQAIIGSENGTNLVVPGSNPFCFTDMGQASVNIRLKSNCRKFTPGKGF